MAAQGEPHDRLAREKRSAQSKAAWAAKRKASEPPT